jgi:hypothetical protein
MGNASNEKGNSGELAFGYAIFAVILFVVFIGIFASLPALTESKVTGPLMVIFIVCLVMGALIWAAASIAANTAPPGSIEVWTLFITLVINLPLALFGVATGVATLADAKKSLTQ